jgi:thioredoxin-like negative regulator of GroEL
LRSGVDLRSVFGIRSVLALTGEFASPETPAPTSVAREVTLVLPRRGEMILTSARALMAGGHYREALTALDTVRPTDPQRGDADRLRAEIQQQLIALATLPAVPAAAPHEDRHIP